MKNMKKLVAALLVLSMMLTLCGEAMAEAKFTKDQAAEGLFIEFTGTARGYKDHSTKNPSKITVKKGSVGLLDEIYGSKWAKVVITDGTMNSLGKDKALWFNTDYLKAAKDQENAFIACIFSSGGDNMSMKDYKTTLEALKGKKIVTTGRANLRKTGSLQGKSQAVVEKGTKLTCTGGIAFDSRTMGFFQVKYNGKKLWVSAGYIKNWFDVLMDAIAEEIGI